TLEGARTTAQAISRRASEGAGRGPETPAIEQTSGRLVGDGHHAARIHAELDHIGVPPEPASRGLEVGGIHELREARDGEWCLRTDARLGHRSGPELRTISLRHRVDAAELGQPTHAVHLDVPHFRAAQSDDLFRVALTAQGLVETDVGPEYSSELRMPHELIRGEGLLDVEETGVVERAQRLLIPRPTIGAVRIYREGEVGPGHPGSRGFHRLGVPSRRDF